MATKKKLTLADLKYQIDYLAKELEAHNKRLYDVETYVAAHTEHYDPPTKPVAFTKPEKLPRGKKATGS